MAIKITQISKDFNMKSKDVLDMFKEIGLEKKSGASIQDDEYELFVHLATFSHQIKNVNDYIDGKTKITVSGEKASEDKTEEKPLPAPKAEVKAAPKAEPKAEPKSAEDKKDAPKVQSKPMQPARTEAPRKEAFAPQKRTDRPQQPFERKEGKPQFQQRPDNRGDKTRFNGFNKYNDRPSDDPFAKRRGDLNRTAEGYRKAQPNDASRRQDVNNQKPNQPAPNLQKPAQQPSALRPAQQAQLEKQQRQQNQSVAAQKQEKPAVKKEEKKLAQKQQFKTITPT